MKLNNPFLVRGYYGPEYFCDRQKGVVYDRFFGVWLKGAR